MAEIKVNGLEEYMARIEKLGKESEEITKRGVFAGATVVADAIKVGLKAIPVDERFGTEDNPVNGIGRMQKSDIFLFLCFHIHPIQLL